MPTTPVPTACRAPCARRCGGSSVCADRGHDTEQRFDARKVARMQEALRRGEFEVDAAAIAERLLSLGPALLGRPIN